MLVTEKTFDEAVEFLSKSTFLTCDTETNYTDFQYDRYIIGIAMLGVGEDYEERTFYFPFRHKHELRLTEEDNNLPLELIQPLLSLIEKSKTIWHNGLFDIRNLADEGFPADDYFYYDTLLLSYMEDENKFDHKLFSLGKIVGEHKLGKELDKVAKGLGEGNKANGWSKIPPTVMGKYAEEDVVITWKLFKLFYSRVEEEAQLDLYPREIEVAHMIRRMEDRGVLLDRKETEALIAKTQHEIQELREELGFDPLKRTELAHRLHGRPPAGLALLPAALSKQKSTEFPRGIPIMDEDALSRIDHPLCEQVLQYRSLTKSQSTYYQGFLDRLDPTDRIHASFKQHGTKTTRWSCENPNLQNLPRDIEETPVKKLLRATPGYQLWEFDYSQIEFRLGTVYAECESIISAYREGGDVHIITAQNVGAYNAFPQNPERARYVGKQTNYLTIYGGGAPTLQKQLWRDARIDVPEAKCKGFLVKFHETTPEYREMAYNVEAYAKRKGYIDLWNGRRRHFREEYDCRKAFNSLVQGGAAQIMIESMLKLDKEGYRMIAQVHDSVWIELPENSVEEDSKKIKEIMSDWVTEGFEIPFTVDEKRIA